MSDLFQVIVVLAAMAIPASAQTASRTYYDGQGRFAGSSVTRGSSSSFYGSNGQFAGSAIRNGNTSSFYDAQGRFVGTSIGPRR